jgi:hypothetical protein
MRGALHSRHELSIQARSNVPFIFRSCRSSGGSSDNPDPIGRRSRRDTVCKANFSMFLIAIYSWYSSSSKIFPGWWLAYWTKALNHVWISSWGRMIFAWQTAFDKQDRGSIQIFNFFGFAHRPFCSGNFYFFRRFSTISSFYKISVSKISMSRCGSRFSSMWATLGFKACTSDMAPTVVCDLRKLVAHLSLWTHPH